MTIRNLCGDGGIPIFCPKCGKENPDGVVRCEHCFEPLPPPPNQGQPENMNQSEPFTQQTQGYNQYQPYGPDGYNQGGMPPCPKDYLVLNIVFGILALCGCVGIVTGIIGIVFSAQVKSKYNAGDYAGAVSASKVAKAMFIVNLVLAILGIIGNIFGLIWNVTYGAYWFEEFMYDFMYNMGIY